MGVHVVVGVDVNVKMTSEAEVHVDVSNDDRS